MFLKNLAAATVGGAGTGLASTARPDEQPVLVRKGEHLAEAIKTDVVVVGAGASGVPAAIAAARGGARVLLLEEDQLPGGAPVDMYVASLCGFPRVGIFQEMLEHLSRLATKAWPHPNNWFLPVVYTQAILEMLKAEANIQLICGATVHEVLLSEGTRNRVRGVRFQRGAERTQSVEAAVTIDATGTGLVAAFAGCKYLYGRQARSDFHEPVGPEQADTKVLPCTLMMIIQRLQGERPAAPFKPDVQLCQAVRVECEDTRDPACIAQSHHEALRLVTPRIQNLHERGYLVHVAPKLGVREVRRVIGETVITYNDLKSGKHPDDTVATGKYFIDAVGEKEHDDSPMPSFGIPYRALLPKDMDGLLLAGKAISGTHLAHSAYRVQPIMAGIGQAAGTAAAMAALNKTDARAITVTELQRQLKRTGILYERSDHNA